MGNKVRLINSAEETARELAEQIFPARAKAGTHPGKCIPEPVFVTSGDAEMFRLIAEEWLDRPVTVEHHSLAGSFQS